MKNFMKFGLIMAMLFGMAFSAFAGTKDFKLRLNAVGKTISYKFGEEPKAGVKKPVLVSKRNGRVSMSIINSDQTPVEVTILDKDGSEIYRDTFPAALSTIKMFNFANVGYGDYTFVTRYGNKTFTESVKAGN